MSDRLHCVVTTNKRQQKSNHNAQIVLSLGMEHINIDIPIPINGLYYTLYEVSMVFKDSNMEIFHFTIW